jgi:hypothetical protein
MKNYYQDFFLFLKMENINKKCFAYPQEEFLFRIHHTNVNMTRLRVISARRV